MAVRSYKSELVGVFGYPVAENPTVVMMEAAFRALGLDWRYLTVEVAPERLADAMKGMRAIGMRGVNLTMPHKVAVLDHLDDVADDARLIGAVNTVVAREGRLIGENTDGKGFIESLASARSVDVRNARVLILGAGGAARAIALELALRGAPSLVIANRSAGRGEALAKDIGEKTKCEASFLPWDPPQPGRPTVVEVLPSHLPRALAGICGYRDGDGTGRTSIRAAVLRTLRSAARLEFEMEDAAQVVGDGHGIALDAVLGAVAVAAAQEGGFQQVPHNVPRSEGWIYSIPGEPWRG